MRHRSLSVRKEADVSAQLSSWPTQQLRMELTQEPLRVLVQHMRPKVKPVRSIEKFCGILMTLLDRSGGKLPRLAATQILNRSRNNSQCQALPLAECEHSSHRVVSSGAYSIIAEERPQLLRPSSCGLTPTQTVSHAPSLGLGGRVRLYLCIWGWDGEIDRTQRVTNGTGATATLNSIAPFYYGLPEFLSIHLGHASSSTTRPSLICPCWLGTRNSTRVPFSNTMSSFGSRGVSGMKP